MKVYYLYNDSGNGYEYKKDIVASNMDDAISQIPRKYKRYILTESKLTAKPMLNGLHEILKPIHP